MTWEQMFWLGVVSLLVLASLAVVVSLLLRAGAGVIAFEGRATAATSAERGHLSTPAPVMADHPVGQPYTSGSS